MNDERTKRQFLLANVKQLYKSLTLIYIMHCLKIWGTQEEYINICIFTCIYIKKITECKMRVVEGDYLVKLKDFSKKHFINRYRSRKPPPFCLQKMTLLLNQQVFTYWYWGSLPLSSAGYPGAVGITPHKPTWHSHHTKLIA